MSLWLLSCPQRSAPAPASHHFKDVVEPLGRVPDAAARLESAHTSKDEVATHELRQALHIFGRLLIARFLPDAKNDNGRPCGFGRPAIDSRGIFGLNGRVTACSGLSPGHSHGWGFSIRTRGGFASKMRSDPRDPRRRPDWFFIPHRAAIHAVAITTYKRERKGSYELVAVDFSPRD
jgi:hypothetical protein